MLRNLANESMGGISGIESFMNLAPILVSILKSGKGGKSDSISNLDWITSTTDEIVAMDKWHGYKISFEIHSHLLFHIDIIY